MEQKEILRVVVLPLLISFVVFGSNNIIPSVKASKKGKFQIYFSNALKYFSAIHSFDIHLNIQFIRME